ARPQSSARAALESAKAPGPPPPRAAIEAARTSIDRAAAEQRPRGAGIGESPRSSAAPRRHRSCPHQH
ncbi:hypothetical protein C0Q16_29745, partial [Klebsiella pneumoniae]